MRAFWRAHRNGLALLKIEASGCRRFPSEIPDVRQGQWYCFGSPEAEQLRNPRRVSPLHASLTRSPMVYIQTDAPSTGEQRRPLWIVRQSSGINAYI